MEGRVCIVTGVSSGIGLATCRNLISAGAFVLGVDIAATPPVSASSENFKFHQSDLMQPLAAVAIVEACRGIFGERIDALINIAGVMDSLASVDTLTDDEWDRVIAINLTAPVKLMREVVRVMQVQRSGSIVNVSSKAGMSGAVAGVAYTASKHGLIGATKNVAWRYKDDKVRCNAICPGAVNGTNIMGSVSAAAIDLLACGAAAPIHEAHK